MTTDQITVADVIAQACAERGVKRAFGVPGGGSSLDLIAAFGRHGIAFNLCRTETGATLMAAADAEIRHGFGVVITTQGPGTASGMNGLAHAWLDRAPVLYITDGWTEAQKGFDSHQVFDQQAMSTSVVKAFSRMESDDVEGELDDLIVAMLDAPWGPVHLELTRSNAARVVADLQRRQPTREDTLPVAQKAVDDLADVRDLLSTSRRPVLLVGLECREPGVPQVLLQLAQRLGCPVLTTYKAKGVISDEFDAVIGHFTGGAAERECIDQADLIVLCGLDPVELIGRPWPYTAPVVDLALVCHPVHYVEPQAASYGPLAARLLVLLDACEPSAWAQEEIASLRSSMSRRLAVPAGGLGLSPQRVVELAMQADWSQRPAITVDAGAHMFSAMAFWHTRSAGGALISNGLATMGFALPAAIARALETPDVPTIAFTGDGGLAMCAGELATAVQVGARVCVVVFNDRVLSLIALKQRDRGMADAGVRLSFVDFASVARGFGMRAFTANTEAEYEQALQDAAATDGPCLVDVSVNPGGYSEQSKALRG